MIPLEVHLVLLSLSLFLLAMTTFAASHSVALLSVSNTIMMICVPFLGVSPIAVFGHFTNAGNIFYAVGMFGFSLTFIVYGAPAAHAFIRNNLFAFVLVFGSVFALQLAYVLDNFFDARVQVAGARLLTFGLVQSLHVILLGRRSRLPASLHAIVVTLSMQILDAIMFFPIAFFGLLPPVVILEYGIVGVLLRSTVTLLSAPFLELLLKRERGKRQTMPQS